MEMTNVKDTVSIEKNSRGVNWSFSIHSEIGLVREWEIMKKDIDTIVADLNSRFGEKEEKTVKTNL